jgi:AraC-like DNA-binding protein/uncharacterized RmlC-like cupin family protein
MDNFIILTRMTSIRKREGFDGQRAIIVPAKIISQQCTGNTLIRDAYITDIGYYPQARYHYRKRTNGIDQNILIYCIEGSGWAKIKNDQVSIGPGDFFIVPSNTPHSYAANEAHPWTIYWLHIKGKTSDAMVASIIGELKGYKGNINNNPARIALFEEIYTNLERGYSNENIIYSNMCLWNFIASFHFSDKFNTTIPRKTNEVTGIAIDFMQNHINGTLSLAEIAKQANLSVSHFAAMFHKKTGFAPIEYFNHLKIQKACQYLQFTELRMKEIADQLGIQDSYYFSRLFKKLMGISPLEYRKRSQR